MVKQGYKQTEIGVIPEDWEVKNLIEVSNKITDGTHDTPKAVEKGIPYLTAIHVKENYIDYNNCYYLPESTHKTIYNRCNPEKNDVLMVNIGAGVGNCGLNSVDYEFSLKNVALIKPNKEFLIGPFLNQWQNFNRDWILRNIITGGAQPFLSLNQIGNLQIPLPPLAEQETIASALSDSDAWIDSLEQLIAKKRLIKQGAMQTLLTPKEDWEVKKLGEVCNIIKGQQFNSEYLTDEGDFPCYSGGINPSGYSEKFNEKKNTIIISEGGNSCGYVNFIKTNFWLGGHCYKIVFKTKDLEQHFTYQLLKFNQDKIMALRVGSGLPNIQKKSLEDFAIQFPSLSVQERIATILSDMDAELEALATQLGKARQIKQGMMQELLTGRIRLV